MLKSVTWSVNVPLLTAWVESPLYAPAIVTDPAAVPVNITEQFAVVPLPLRVQVAMLKLPAAPVLVKLTMPVGVMGVPADASVTVAVQVDAWLTVTVDGLQFTEVDVTLGLTITLVVPELPL
jgi:hypothetical protein